MVPEDEHLPAPAPVPKWLAWGETAVLTTALPVIGLLLRPQDPLFVEGHFFWPLLGPLLVCLRYGLPYGLSGSAALIAGLVLLDPKRASGELIVAILAVMMSAGEFSNLWRRRVERAERISREHQRRGARFLRAYQALTASHEQLERRLRSSTTSLREALSALRRRLATSPAGPESEQSLQRAVLELFADQTGMQLAAFYPADKDGRLLPASTLFGSLAPASPTHELFLEALRRRAVVSLALDEASTRTGGQDPLVAVPLLDTDEQVEGVIAIYDMPYAALRDEALLLLAVLGGYVGDLLASYRRPTGPEEAARFEAELSRCLSDLERLGLPSTLLCVTGSGLAAHRVLAELTAERRVVDQCCITRIATGSSVLAMILPLTEASGGEALQRRLEKSVKSKADPVNIQSRVRELQPDDTISELLEFIREQEPTHVVQPLRRARL